MRVLMFGRGVISTLYGRALQTAGHDVEFYVRPGRASEYGDAVTVDVIDARRGWRAQKTRELIPTRLRESIAPGDQFDLIILSVGHHRLAEAAAFLAPRIGAATVLVLGNVWDEPVAAIAPLPPDQVVFGFPQAGGGYTDDGVLCGVLFRSVLLEKSPRQRTTNVRNLFRSAGFTIREQEDLRGWLQLHFIADAGMFSQSIQTGSMATMIGDRQALHGALLTARELLPLLTARGVDLTQHRSTLMQYRAPLLTAIGMSFATRHVPIAQVSMAAHTNPYAPEALAVLHDALTSAHHHLVPAPRLEAAIRHTS